MDLKNLFGFENKNVVISGSASGMSKAATELLIALGANVYAVDINDIDLPVKQAYKADLSSKEEIDKWLETLPEKVDALFLCHGISQFPGRELLVQKVNFYSQKYITEQLLPRISDHGSISYIASVGSFGWQQEFNKCLEVVNCDDWDSAMSWYENNKEVYDANRAYTFAKKCLASYVINKCADPKYRGRYIRLNAIMPGDTTTGLTDDFNKSTGNGDAEAGAKVIEQMFLGGWNGYAAEPKDMGYPLVTIGSDICSYMSGQLVYIDFGLTSNWTSQGLISSVQKPIEEMSKQK